MERAIGGVGIDQNICLVACNRLNQRSHLGSFQFDEVPIEIEVLCIFAKAHSRNGAHLAWAMKQSNPFVRIGIEVGDGHDDEFFSPVAR